MLPTVVHAHELLLADAKPGGPNTHFPSRMLRDVPRDQIMPWPFPEFLDNPGCRWLQALKRVYTTPLSFPSSLSPEAGLLIHALVRNIQPATVVETGCFIGVSSIWIAAALADLPTPGHLHSFDWFGPIGPGPWRVVSITEGRRELVQSHVEEAGVAEHVTFYQGLSAPTIVGLRDSGKIGRVQMAFLDADHSEKGVWEDFNAVEPMLDVGGFVLLHDTFPDICGWQGPRKLMDKVAERAAGKYEVSDIYLAPVNFGFGLLRRIG